MDELGRLVVRAREGDAEAFAVMVHRFQDMAVGYGCALLGDRQAAEDASQEAFLEAYGGLRELRDPEAFAGWFRCILHKQCDRIRRRPARTLLGLQAALESAIDSANQRNEMERGEAKDKIQDAVDSLPGHERAAVLLYYMSGHSYKEVAAFLAVPVTTVKKRLHSARSRLRERLSDLVEDGLREQRPSRDDRFAGRVMEILKAARAGDAGRVMELLEQDPRLAAARDPFGNTALVVAVNSGHQALAELMLASGVTPGLHESAAIGGNDRVRAILDLDPTKVDEFSAEGFTPLTLAAHFGHRKTAELILERGADIDRVSRHAVGVTPLHAALFGRQVAMALFLIERGANVRIPRGGDHWPRAGWTALHYAAGFGFAELIEPLLGRGADPSARDHEGRTAIDLAKTEGHHAIEATLRRWAVQS